MLSIVQLLPAFPRLLAFMFFLTSLFSLSVPIFSRPMDLPVPLLTASCALMILPSAHCFLCPHTTAQVRFCSLPHGGLPL